MNSRFFAALGAYGVLIALSFWLLTGIVLKAVLFLFIALLAKTLIAWKAGL